ncbi:hypothetical protein E3E25_01240 [Thermococcus sp. MAR1]|nr:hypothetical protein [Thermococcus sp. MAR1]
MYVDDNVKKTIREALEKSIKIADKLIPDVSSVRHLDATSRAIANDAEDPFQILRNAGIDIEPELEEFRQFLAGISGKKIEPKKPKFPETKKAVEEELRKAGIPEEKVKVVAPRLATAVWLDKWFENAVKSYTYKKLGGVPLDEIKNLRNMILAKKHLLENAAKVMEEHWTRNNHVKIGERHVEGKMLPLVREHTPEMFEDLENIRKAVKEGKMSVEEALLRLHAELFVISKALESIGELTGTPEYLAPNPRPLGVSDRYVVTLDKVRKIHEKLRGTLRIYLR